MLRKGQLNFIKLLKIFMIFCFCVLGSRLFYVQAIQHDKYKGISEGRVNSRYQGKYIGNDTGCPNSGDGSRVNCFGRSCDTGSFY